MTTIAVCSASTKSHGFFWSKQTTDLHSFVPGFCEQCGCTLCELRDCDELYFASSGGKARFERSEGNLLWEFYLCSFHLKHLSSFVHSALCSVPHSISVPSVWRFVRILVVGFECEELDVLRHRSGFSGFLSSLLCQIRITCAQTRPWCGVQVRQSHVGDPVISNCQYNPSLRWSFTTFSYPKLGDESFDDHLSHVHDL